ncbi:uncharacterized protein LOC119987121 isoform X5 [Tripterygium wilfordii]|uniref:uncharacterized protein LOC119987121 isoform X5 n=1 Tax=Tripterygium wilfordii TaxID=458696 RepID=UPI0018F82197|nr:uncharacterized protein LOC119987121 isoform X5 [Tripterygium wilfordii]XP_038687819.1 uncharacterized protein LOC119987121 isoform X5 [Tripterygium wilfordii]XP_038687820.1 uncharacterized protein LOC119987121 isoform X5 [Tripterygium wilfordii]
MRSWQNMTAESFGMGLSSSGRWTLHLQRFQVGACPREFSWKPSVLRAWWGETFFPKNPVSSFFSSFQLHVLQILSHAYFSSSFFPFSCRKEHHSWALRFRSLRGCTQYLSMNSERNNTVNNVQLSSTQFMLLLWLLDLMQMWPTASMHLPDGYQRHITGNTKCNLQVGGS